MAKKVSTKKAKRSDSDALASKVTLLDPPASDPRARAERDAREYAALVELQQSALPLESKPLAGVLAHAVGTTEPDPIHGLVQELRLRLMTLHAAVQAGEDGLLSEDDLTLELFMLARRAEALEVLIHRASYVTPGIHVSDAAAEE